MEVLRKHKALITTGVVIALVFFYAGVRTGENKVSARVPTLDVVNQDEEKPDNVDFAPFWKAWNILEEKYVSSSTTAKNVSNQDMVWGAIEGLAASLGDPYTVFFPPVESELFEADIRGNFEGVGMEITTQNGILTVITPLKGSPAEQAGVLPGDIILKVDDEPSSKLSADEAVEIIRGPKGTPVTFTIIREEVEEPLEITVIRDTINIPTIQTKELGNGIFEIELYNFSAQSPNLFRGALREFIESGNDKLILDLRGNPGGYLEAAIDMASWFLPSGKVIVRESFGVEEGEKAYRSRGYDIFNDNLKFVILVNEGSASASEILAGALQSHGKATIIGEQTFGKGSVQELVSVTPETSLKVTIARWLTPEGLSISEEGIIPDIVIKSSASDILEGRDPQLERAKEYLLNS